MDGGAAIIILAPALAQVAITTGIHPLHFGFVMVFNLVIGEITPPLGIVLFAVSGITKIEVIHLFKALIPFPHGGTGGSLPRQLFLLSGPLDPQSPGFCLRERGINHPM